MLMATVVILMLTVIMMMMMSITWKMTGDRCDH